MRGRTPPRKLKKTNTRKSARRKKKRGLRTAECGPTQWEDHKIGKEHKDLEGSPERPDASDVHTGERMHVSPDLQRRTRSAMRMVPPR